MLISCFVDCACCRAGRGPAYPPGCAREASRHTASTGCPRMRPCSTGPASRTPTRRERGRGARHATAAAGGAAPPGGGAPRSRPASSLASPFPTWAASSGLATGRLQPGLCCPSMSCRPLCAQGLISEWQRSTAAQQAPPPTTRLPTVRHHPPAAAACRKTLNFDDLWDVAVEDGAASVSDAFQWNLAGADGVVWRAMWRTHGRTFVLGERGAAGAGCPAPRPRAVGVALPRAAMRPRSAVLPAACGAGSRRRS